jgi:hypothetical protein
MASLPPKSEKALSLKQPWLDCVLFLGKGVENRTWRTNYRGPVVLHASRGWDKSGEAYVRKVWRGSEVELNRFICAAWWRRGGFYGIANIVDVVPLDLFISKDHWAFGPQCWILKDVQPVKMSVAVKGSLGLWKVPAGTIKMLS